MSRSYVHSTGTNPAEFYLRVGTICHPAPPEAPPLIDCGTRTICVTTIQMPVIRGVTDTGRSVLRTYELAPANPVFRMVRRMFRWR